ncbi:MAG: hypothetical protein MI861_26330, partial [Pirellulales bacterium]|nr:hypothetical protein [Pirellulales bacterium]
MMYALSHARLASLLLALIPLGAAGADQGGPLPVKTEDWHSLYLSETYQSDDGESLPYRLLVPKRIEPAKKYPLIVFFHGAGERGSDNQLQLIHAASQFAREDRR